MNKDFLAWLADENKSFFSTTINSVTYHVFRVQLDWNFDYLFVSEAYHDRNVSRRNKFTFAGMYCRKDREIYDGQSSLLPLAGEDIRERSSDLLLKQMIQSVRERVEAIIGNDRKKLQVTKITDKYTRRDLQYFRKNGAKAEARRLYLKGAELSDITFRCQYHWSFWFEECLRAYILNPEMYVQQQAAEYVANEQEKILLQFLKNDALIFAFKEIVEHPEDPVHTIRKIIAAMNDTTAKTVNVTICKEGEEFTFKTEAKELRSDPTTYYNIWSMASADRRKFWERFGNGAAYYPQEIVRITYARAVLYEAGK